MAGWRRTHKGRGGNREFNDWIVFDLGGFGEVEMVRIRLDVHYRWGNVPKVMYLDLANCDDEEYALSMIQKFEPMSYDDDYHNPDDPDSRSGMLVQLRQQRVEKEKVCVLVTLCEVVHGVSW